MSDDVRSKLKMTAAQIEALARADIEGESKKKPAAKKKTEAKAKEPEPAPVDPLVEKSKHLASWLIDGVQSASRKTGMVDDNDELRKDLMDDPLCRDDLALFLKDWIPYMPYPGLVTGAVTWIRHYLTKGKKEETTSPAE